MNEQIHILSPWAEVTVDGEITNKPQVLIDHPALVRMTDITGTPTVNIPNDPNNLVCRVVGPTATIDAIVADPDYVLMEGTRGPYDQTPAAFSNDIPTQPEYVAWRNSITAMQHGGKPVWTTGQFNQAVGNQPDGRMWSEINEDMRVFLASAPAGGGPP